jgi:hypothetical protein
MTTKHLVSKHEYINRENLIGKNMKFISHAPVELSPEDDIGEISLESAEGVVIDVIQEDGMYWAVIEVE